VTDVLTQVLAGLRERAGLRSLDFDVPAEELCDALWLCLQGMPPLGDRPAVMQDDSSPGPGGPRRRRSSGEGDAARNGQPPTGHYLHGQTGSATQAGASESRPSTSVWLPDAPALPYARALARALRPLRYDHRQTYLTGDVDEDATAKRIAQTGIRVPVWRTTRRRRLDIDLVLDLGGSGPLWEELAAELRGMLEIHGAFRSVRFWTLDSDSADLTLRIGHLDPATASDPRGTYPWDAVCPPPRRPIVFVLTDGTGQAWSTGEVRRPLRRWAGAATVALIQLLPQEMLNWTALDVVPVTFYPGDDGYHSGSRIHVDEADLSVAGLDQDSLPAATAIPVIGLEVSWLRSWLPLLRGTQAGRVPGFALLIPGPQSKPKPVAAPAREAEAEERPVELPGTGEAGPAAWADETWAEELMFSGVMADTDGERRVKRFLITASGEAVRLARLLSVEPDGFNLNVMRKIKYELLRAAKIPVMAEVMLGGLVYWTSSAGATAPASMLTFNWYPGVREVLQERPYGDVEFEQDKKRVAEALKADRGTGRWYPAVLVRPDGDSVTLIPAGTEPVVPDAGAPASAIVSDQAIAAVSDRREREVAVPSSESAARTLRIGLWGSPTSGRTTYLTVLASAGWQRWRRHAEWRVSAVDPATKKYLETSAETLAEKKFPRSNLPFDRKVNELSFHLERKQQEGARRRRGPTPVANITLEIQDRGGGQFGTEEKQESANRYLAESDVLLYFFDPTYDNSDEAIHKFHSVDFFQMVEAHLGMVAVQRDTLYHGFLPQHIAVCIAKLDDQHVFDVARDNGCTETDPGTGTRYVPSRRARRLFEKICQEQHRSEADFLLNRLQNSFHPDRISFHALSSIGFWVPEDGEFDPDDVCNVIREPQPAGDMSPVERRIRGPIRPVHILDPLISLVERAERDS